MKIKIFFLITIILSTLNAVEILPFNKELNEVKLEKERSLLIISKNVKKVWTKEELENIPLVKSTIRTRWHEKSEFIGVKLSILLEKSGIKSFKRLFIKAADGYKVVLKSSEDNIEEAIVVMRINRKPLTLEAKGPYFLIWPFLAEKLVKGEIGAAKWIWNISEIKKVR